MKLDILMLGARRTGKSSTLSVMVDEFEKITEAGEIKIVPDQSTAKLLNRKKSDLKAMFNKFKPGERWKGDESPNDNSYNYIFNILTKDSKEPIILDFKDIPGEMLAKEEEHESVMNFMNGSDIIIIAIDTPHLVEENGAYNRFNVPTYIENCFAEMDSSKDKPRLVLFVPLKCEKYYHENRMEEVANSIINNKYYGRILKSIENDEKKSKLYTVAITPILTLGGVVFDDFKRDKDGYVERTQNSGALANRPAAAYYRLYEKNPVYKPKYCEQPVLYVLNFALAVAGVNAAIEKKRKSEKKKGNKGLKVLGWVATGIAFGLIGLSVRISVKLIKKFRTIYDNKALVKGIQSSRMAFKVSGDGYRLIYDPMKIKGE